ncbi:putative vesicle-associated membrane protein 726 [Lolium rigidum]|uniref:putative vesicle-associated membrane protein 726 n=1 Tax=Lolium rigidum TaxID=89674 RepID=UPI001F5C6E22|nr:putative vesicle-associated membrane protein 726 [Lolium rigidum]
MWASIADGAIITSAFAQLKYLALERVTVSECSLQAIIDGCPAIECLQLGTKDQVQLKELVVKNICPLPREAAMPKLKEQMQYCMDHPQELSRLSKVKAQVSEVKGIMIKNIDDTIQRRVQIDDLATSAELLHEQANDFRQEGTRIRRKMWFENMKVKLIVLGIVAALILIIVLSICVGHKCN